jgi:ABC-type transport system involved in multi-copper enzyme maturation permease subunit
MITNLKAEFRKVFSVRSTYVILVFVFLLEILFAFYTSGWRIGAHDLHNPNTLANDITSAVNAVSIFVALIATLLMTHEYRYNTIMYSLTFSRSRSRVLLAKILVVSAVAIVFTIVVGGLSPLLSVLGAHANHLKFAPQTLHYGTLIWQNLFFGWGYAMAGLLIAALIRNQIGAIVTLFIAPSTVEALLGLLLKKNTVYLPFSALHTVIGQGMGDYVHAITPTHAAEVFMTYLIGGWIIAWILFIRRDAN